MNNVRSLRVEVSILKKMQKELNNRIELLEFELNQIKQEENSEVEVATSLEISALKHISKKKKLALYQLNANQ
ncbi:hypothetical protein ATE49_10580 [Elizabethkingia miricola]|uniref:Uncharacterized protein n=2 Tax=Elizabethkingia miricola TaxID=172045 RepID=A0ABY3NC39_ELIMR|nr:hypothetical protein ATE49_10580 [Elizabethkingia miricola]TYO88032.1 hypothetical protein LX74_03394 [Elizabethkingia miricola]